MKFGLSYVLAMMVFNLGFILTGVFGGNLSNKYEIPLKEMLPLFLAELVMFAGFLLMAVYVARAKGIR